MNFLEKKSNVRIINFLALSFVAFLSQSQIVLGQSTEECQDLDQSASRLTADMAKKVTVKIISEFVKLDSPDGFVRRSLGSGVLVKGKDAYYVVTVQHIFEPDPKNNNLPNPIPDVEFIEIPFQQDNPPVPIQFETVKKSNVELDSILLRLKTQDQNWIATSIQPTMVKGESLLVSGFPYDKQGNFKCVYSTALNTNIPYIFYKPNGTNKSERGMSGGSILNSEGKLVGIHEGFANKEETHERGIPASVWLPIFSNQLGFTNNSIQTSSTSEKRPKPEVDGSKLPPVRGLW